MCSLNQKLWVHQTVTHQAPLYHSLFNKKKLPLRLCNTQNKCVHIYSISVTWWQQVIGFDIADGSISMMSHLLNYTWERCFFYLDHGKHVIGWWHQLDGNLFYTAALKLLFDPRNRGSQFCLNYQIFIISFVYGGRRRIGS